MAALPSEPVRHPSSTPHNATDSCAAAADVAALFQVAAVHIGQKQADVFQACCCVATLP